LSSRSSPSTTCRAWPSAASTTRCVCMCVCLSVCLSVCQSSSCFLFHVFLPTSHVSPPAGAVLPLDQIRERGCCAD
jgi:hypothetical protein